MLLAAQKLSITDTFDLQLSYNSEYLMAMMFSLTGSSPGTVKFPFESFVWAVLVPKGNLVGRYKGYLMKTTGQVDQITTKGKDASVLER